MGRFPIGKILLIIARIPHSTLPTSAPGLPERGMEIAPSDAIQPGKVYKTWHKVSWQLAPTSRWR
jgi:hypothetical protein